MKFSIVVPTRNRSHNLLRTVSSMFRFDYEKRDYEVIVVDNNSSDNTKVTVSKLMNRYQNLHYVTEPRLGPAFARNAGIRAAKYAHIIFLDDDTKFSTELLNNYKKAWHDNPKATLIGGKVISILPKSCRDEKIINLFNKYNWIFSYLDLGDISKELTFYNAVYPKWKQFLYSANLSLRQEKNDPIYFNTDFGRLLFDGRRIAGEDYELCLRLLVQGKKIIYEPSVVINNVVDPKRVTTDFIQMRFFFGGIEMFLLSRETLRITRRMKNTVNKPLPSFNIDLQYVINNIHSKYELLTYLGYFLTKKFFYVDKEKDYSY